MYLPNDPETALRLLWTAMGVSEEAQNKAITEIKECARLMFEPAPAKPTRPQLRVTDGGRRD